MSAATRLEIASRLPTGNRLPASVLHDAGRAEGGDLIGREVE